MSSAAASLTALCSTPAGGCWRCRSTGSTRVETAAWTHGGRRMARVRVEAPGPSPAHLAYAAYVARHRWGSSVQVVESRGGEGFGEVVFEVAGGAR